LEIVGNSHQHRYQNWLELAMLDRGGDAEQRDAECPKEPTQRTKSLELRIFVE
jgi:hypothetical protein